jgi:chromosome segregation ATPase
MCSLSAEFFNELSELENKIEMLLQSLEELRDENAILKQSGDLNGTRVAELESRNKELEGENHGLREQVEALSADLNGEREKISSASERVKGLLAKFDAAL